MDEWEYLVFDCSYNPLQLAIRLSREGKLGWRTISIITKCDYTETVTVVMERKVTEADKMLLEVLTEENEAS
jgi:hypothetical protein